MALIWYVHGVKTLYDTVKISVMQARLSCHPYPIKPHRISAWGSIKLRAKYSMPYMCRRANHLLHNMQHAVGVISSNLPNAYCTQPSIRDDCTRRYYTDKWWETEPV